MATALVPTFWKQNQYIGIQVGTIWSDLEGLGGSVLECLSKLRPSEQLSTIHNPYVFSIQAPTVAGNKTRH